MKPAEGYALARSFVAELISCIYLEKRRSFKYSTEMKLRNVFAVLMIMVLSIGPAMAAQCNASCTNSDDTSMSSMGSVEDMKDCDHCPKQNSSHDQTVNDHCKMAGCHTVSAAAYFHVIKPSRSEHKTAVHPQFISTAVSADLPPPIKPPA